MEPLLIVGHTTGHSAKLWLCGRTGDRSVHIALEPESGRVPVPQRRALSPATDFTSTALFTGLCADKHYRVRARFEGPRRALDRLRGARDEAVCTGSLRTFPDSGDDRDFCFLIGSCNLSVVSLTHLAGLVAGGLGTLAATESLTRDPEGEFPVAKRLLNEVLGFLVPRGFGLLFRITGFEQPRPLLLSPFEGLVGERDGGSDPLERDPPAFVLHMGDQIYFDFPIPGRAPSVDAYRRAYRGAWSEDATLRRFLAQCPHYMTLDDHEIVDNFARDHIPPWVRGEPVPGGGADTKTEDGYLAPATQVYREFVHARHPESPQRDPGASPFFYEFAYGACRFFVLDTRTERYRRKGQVIDEPQMQALKDWLGLHRERIKFIVSSVPFVAELRPQRLAAEDADLSAEESGKKPPDKWCEGPYRRQRDEIIEFLFREGIGNVVFLAGDMHCTYQATMRIGGPGDRLTIHEFASGPIRQLLFARRRDFYEHYRGATSGGVPFATSMGRIHAAASNVVRVTARPRSHELLWEVLHTATRLAPGPGAAVAAAAPPGRGEGAGLVGAPDPHRGRILLGANQWRPPSVTTRS